MFSCDFCEISENTLLYETPLVAAFEAKASKLVNSKSRVKLMKEIKLSDLGVFIRGKVWGKKTLLKFAEGSLKKNEVLWSVLIKRINWNFWRGIFQKVYLVRKSFL